MEILLFSIAGLVAVAAGFALGFTIGRETAPARKPLAFERRPPPTPRPGVSTSAAEEIDRPHARTSKARTDPRRKRNSKKV